MRELLLPEIHKFPNGYRVLEAGCGSGGVLRTHVEVCSTGTVVGMDLHREGLRIASLRTASPLVQADLQRGPFDTVFDVVGLFDVLEHFPQDEEVLEAMRGLLRDEGLLLLTVPAHRFLWSYFDRASHHARRYEVEELEAKLERARFRMEFLSPCMATIFPRLWLVRRLAGTMWMGRGEPADESVLVENQFRVVPLLNALLVASLHWESSRPAKRRRLPFGTSIVALARKRS